jgi:hypothetical protein
MRAVLKSFSVVKSVSGLAEPTSVGLIWISTLTPIEFPSSFPRLASLNPNEKWTDASRWLAGLPVILLFTRGATQTSFA